MKRFASAALMVLVLAGCSAQGPREIRVTVTENGFEPDSVTFAKGLPGTLILTRKTDATCATSIVFDETGRKYDLPLNTDVRVEIPTDQAGTLHYACGMEMFRGIVAVK